MTTRKRVDPDHTRLDRVVAEAREARAAREQGYRASALELATTTSTSVSWTRARSRPATHPRRAPP